LLAGLRLLVWACGAGDGVESATTDATLADTAPAGAEEPETEPAGAEEPDNCSLITPDEATALAGYELEVGEDSILGCGYLPPGSDGRSGVGQTHSAELSTCVEKPLLHDDIGRLFRNVQLAHMAHVAPAAKGGRFIADGQPNLGFGAGADIGGGTRATHSGSDPPRTDCIGHRVRVKARHRKGECDVT